MAQSPAAVPPGAPEQGCPIRVEHDRRRRQFTVRLNGNAGPAAPPFVCARDRGARCEAGDALLGLAGAGYRERRAHAGQPGRAGLRGGGGRRREPRTCSARLFSGLLPGSWERVGRDLPLPPC